MCEMLIYLRNVYSIIETIKANNLIVEKYLVYLMNIIVSIEILTKDKLLEHMPWSNILPSELQNKMKQNS